jgi:hypothetical protein
MNIFEISSLVDRYNVLNDLNTNKQVDRNKMNAEYLLKLFTTLDLEIRPDNTIGFKTINNQQTIQQEQVNYKELVLLTSQMDADVQFEIMSKLNNLTSLLILKYFCHQSAFHLTTIHHLKQNNITITTNPQYQWLTLIYKKLFHVASVQDLNKLIESQNVYSYLKWQRRLSYVFYFISIIIALISLFIKVYSFYKIFIWSYYYFPIGCTGLYKLVKQYNFFNPLLTMFDFIYNYKWQFYISFLLISLTRFKSFLIFNLFNHLIHTICFQFIFIVKQAWSIASFSSTLVMKGCQYISSKLTLCGNYLLNNYYKIDIDALASQFANQVIQFHQ